MSDIDKDLARVGCETPVRDAIHAVAAAHRYQLYDGIPGSYVPLVSDPHTAVAIYANAGYIDFAVNPAQAQQWASRLGVTIVKPHQPTTNYVHVTTEQLAEATIRAQVVELAGTAFMHRAESSANPPSSEGSAGERAIGPTCTTCYEATSLTGVCGCNA